MHIKLADYYGGEAIIKFAGPNTPYLELGGKRHFLTNADVVNLRDLLTRFIEAYKEHEFSPEGLHYPPIEAIDGVDAPDESNEI